MTSIIVTQSPVVPQKSPAEYAEQYRRGLLTEQELFNLCPLAMPLVACLSEWQPLFKTQNSYQKTTDQFNNEYFRATNDTFIRVTLANGQRGAGNSQVEALNCALTTPFMSEDEAIRNSDIGRNGRPVDPSPLAPFKGWHQTLVKGGYFRLARRLLIAMWHKQTDFSNSMYIADGDSEAYESGFAIWLQDNCRWHNTRRGFEAYLTVIAEVANGHTPTAPDSGLTLGDFVEAECPCTAQGEKIAPTEGMSLGQHLQRIISASDFADIQADLDSIAHPDALGDLITPQMQQQWQAQPQATDQATQYVCQHCNGNGKLVHYHACPHCHEGQIGGQPCPHCKTAWEIANYAPCQYCQKRGWLTYQQILSIDGFVTHDLQEWQAGKEYSLYHLTAEEFFALTGIPVPHNPPQFYRLEEVVTSRENGYYTLQVPENHPLATLLEGFVTARHTERLLAAVGYVGLRTCLTLPRPKMVTKQLRQAVAELQELKPLFDDHSLIDDLVKKLEGLL